jgi:oligopeptide/dipeptide ABC transporter ATP-binding protein
VTPLLSVRGIKLDYRSQAGVVRALNGISFDLEPGQALGLVGESGCGKTTVARAILRLLPPNAAIAEGQVLLRGRDIVTMSPDALRAVRWRDIALVTQSAMNALDPVYRVRSQIVEAIQIHEDCSTADARRRAERLFDLVGLKREWLDRYPHEFSGGMRQRAIIAMALALDPALIVADEPTTALDVIMQEQVFEELNRVRREKGIALILITHDIAVVAENCDRVAVMYAGELVEVAGSESLFAEPMHPYTIALCNSFPSLESGSRDLVSIPGAPPDLAAPPPGCRFAPRCPFAQPRCVDQAPALRVMAGGHSVACHFAEQAPVFREAGRAGATWERSESGRQAQA